MNKQEIFDTVVKHLAAQKMRSVGDVDSSNGCAYRGNNGTKCAVGCLIPDEDYDPRIESYNVNQLFMLSLLPEALKEHVDMLNALQRAHDNSTDIQMLLTKLYNIGFINNLNVSAIAQITEWK